tara:strand:+ start:607 stop:765 length:159 start_codon:yes stop_codon:yes gene_type:complete
MAISYKLTKEEISILKIEDGSITWSIPVDKKNRMYQDYLEWVKEGNTAEAAD